MSENAMEKESKEDSQVLSFKPKLAGFSASNNACEVDYKPNKVFAKTDSNIVTKIVKEKIVSDSSVVSEASNTGAHPASFGGKVKRLINMFNSQNSGCKTESSIDGSSTKSQKVGGLFESPVSENQFTDNLNYWKGRVCQSPDQNEHSKSENDKRNETTPKAIPIRTKDVVDELVSSEKILTVNRRCMTEEKIIDKIKQIRFNNVIVSVCRDLLPSANHYIYLFVMIKHCDFTEILAINSGCLNRFTYFKTKMARGSLQYPLESLVEQAKSTFENDGCKELWLTSEDLSAHGRDIGLVLPDLLNELVKIIPNDCMMRLGMANPPYILNYLDDIAKILNHPRVYSFATDFICAFPIETADDFEESSSLVKKDKFPSLFISQLEEDKNVDLPEQQLDFASSNSSISNFSFLSDDINQEVKNFHIPNLQFDSDDDEVSNRGSSENILRDNLLYMTEKQQQDIIEQLVDMIQFQSKHALQIGNALKTLRTEAKFTSTLTKTEVEWFAEIPSERLTEAVLLYRNSIINARRFGLMKIAIDKDLTYIVPRAKIRFNNVTVSVFRDLLPSANHYIYLFVMIKHRDQIAASRPIYVNEALHHGIGFVEFIDGLEIEEVSADFSVIIEVYGAVYEKQLDAWSMNDFHCLNGFFPNSPDYAISEPEQFTRMGQLTLTRQNLQISPQRLKNTKYPVEPRIAFSYICQVTDSDDLKWQGFISIYRMVEGRGAWKRSFGKIANGRLNLWNYPEDAKINVPLLSLNICDMSGPAQPSNDEELGSEHSFVMKLIDAKNSIVRIMLSTAERERVLATINASYEFHNTWAQF